MSFALLDLTVRASRRAGFSADSEAAAHQCSRKINKTESASRTTAANKISRRFEPFLVNSELVSAIGNATATVTLSPFGPLRSTARSTARSRIEAASKGWQKT